MPAPESASTVKDAPRLRSSRTRSGSSGCVRAGLPPAEGGHQRRRRQQEAPGQRGAPAVRLGVGEAVDDAEQAGGDQQRCRGCPASGRSAGAPLRSSAMPPMKARHGEDQVDVQRPAPAEVLGEHTAEQQADAAAGAGDGAVDAEGLGALLGVGEGRVEQRERRGGEQGAEQALQGAARRPAPRSSVPRRPVRRRRRSRRRRPGRRSCGRTGRPAGRRAAAASRRRGSRR